MTKPKIKMPAKYRLSRSDALKALALAFRADPNLSAAEAARRLFYSNATMRTKIGWAELTRSMIIERRPSENQE